MLSGVLPRPTQAGMSEYLGPDTPPIESLPRRIQTFDTEFKVPDDITPYPLRTPAQQFVLLNIAHKNHRPTHEQPAFRIIGAFATREEVAAYVAEHYPNPKESIFACPVHQLIPLCKSHGKQLDGEYCQRTIDDIIALHENLLKTKNEDFKQSIANQQIGTIGSSLTAAREKARKHRENSSHVKLVSEKFKSRTAGFQPVGIAMPNSKCIAKQQFAVVIVLQDIRTKPLHGEAELEPLIAVLFVAGAKEDASAYSRYTASKVYKDCTIDVVDMYQWLFPESIEADTIQAEEYGNQELNGIMQARNANKSQMSEYERWYAENGADDGVTRVTADM